MEWVKQLEEWKQKGFVTWKDNESLSKYTTWKIGGPADYFMQIFSVEGIREVVSYAKRTNTPYFILGNGSNLLVRDGGMKGVVMQLAGDLASWRIEERNTETVRVRVNAGYLLVRFAMEMAKKGYSGLEFVGGIPGTVGGAVTMNAGAHGGEMKDIVQEVTVLTETGEVLALQPEDMEFTYRYSSVKERKYIVLDAVLELKVSDKEAIMNKTKSFREIRLRTQPLKEASCGSVFKNPLPQYAGQLVESLGMKGLQIGGARISDLHGNFIVNTGGATASDVMALMEYIERQVKESYGVVLEREVKIVGRE